MCPVTAALGEEIRNGSSYTQQPVWQWSPNGMAILDGYHLLGISKDMSLGIHILVGVLFYLPCSGQFHSRILVIAGLR